MAIPWLLKWKRHAKLDMNCVYIFWFDIPVGDIHGVEVLDRSRDLVDNFHSFALREGVFRSLL